MTLDFGIADMSEYQDNEISVPNFDVVSTFSSKTQAEDVLAEIRYNERIVEFIKKLIMRKSSTREEEVLIMVLKDILEEEL